MRLPFDDNYPITQGFGVNPSNYAQFNLKGHDGLDYGLPSGTPVKAPHDGQVLEVNYDQAGYGNYIKIENPAEGSVLAHLEKAVVMVGYQVKEGDLIGYSDNTGYSTGPHLHWGYYRIPRDRGNGFNGFIDQTPYLNGTPIAEQVVKDPVVALDQPKVYTQSEYDAAMADRAKFWQESDTLQKQVDTLTAQLTQMQQERDTALQTAQKASNDNLVCNQVLSGFRALGYNSVDDVTKALKEKDDTILGVKTQLQQSLDRNASLATNLSKKDQEDSTAIDSGIKAEKELADLKSQMGEIVKAIGTRPGLWNILGSISSFKKAIVDAESQLSTLKGSLSAPTKQQVKTDVNWLMNFLHLT